MMSCLSSVDKIFVVFKTLILSLILFVLGFIYGQTVIQYTLSDYVCYLA